MSRQSRLEQTVRRITADPAHYPQTSRAQATKTADWILSYAAKMSTEWQNITARMDNGDWFWIAQTLTYWGLAEYDPRPAKSEYRRNPLTGERELYEEGCRCFFRLKSESLEEV